ncbi:MAG: OB-fold nucleic acid binding domain-containing protein [Schaalia hyovaginalis]|uniref:OB-fold nucleic acid binding domain-containing protein n=1 Tax=Schaalia hyovaginalis TaxID=29316 RepID=UPI002A9183A4|nr:OB-fold nucleic acid binding domain-containing protein [Schaalia hyovaginalis]MDY5505544.1 OB-fold nucleic acid binding domain-containing protein [Schaalia hyovaginalis]
MRAIDLTGEAEGAVVSVAGIVTHRQRPRTAKGITFLSLEDETGLINVSCVKGVWEAHKSAGLFSRALEVRGRLQLGDGAIGIEAHSLRPLSIPVPARSRDFR